MTRRLPPDAFAHYLGLGLGRSYQAVADHFGVSKQAVVTLAAKEDWPARLREAEQRVAEAAAKKAEESIEQMNERHLKSLKAIQRKALEGLRSLALTNAMDAVRALDLAIRQERVVRGEPGDRSSIEVGDVIRREYERWLAPAGEEGEADGAGAPPDSQPSAVSDATPPPVASEADDAQGARAADADESGVDA